MEDDLISCLTRQVKEDVIENYLTERRLLEIQREELEEQARNAWTFAEETGLRFTRLAFLMVEDKALNRLRALLNVQKDSYWDQCMGKPFAGGVRFIRVAALTSRARFRKLVTEAYRRMLQWAEKYDKTFHELKTGCNAININIKTFQDRFDLLSILNFLKSLDVCTLEQKRFLGENFTAEEITSIDSKLHINTVSMDRFELPSPPKLPQRQRGEETIIELANEVYSRHENQVRRIMR